MSGFPQPLAGRSLIDLSLLLPGPLATSMLQTFGAQVIKLEPPGGDPLLGISAALHRQLNHAKQIERVDLKAPQGLRRLLELLPGASGIIEGFRPGVMTALGLGAEQLQAINPRLVVVSLSGFGATGPYRDQPAHDMTVLGVGGYFSLPSQLDGAITRPNIRLADVLAAQTTAFATFVAIQEAERTGLGQVVDTSLFDAMAAPALMPLLARSDASVPPEAQSQVMADSAIYACADGRHVCIATLEDKHWARFVAVATPPGHALRAPCFETRTGRDQDKSGLARLLAELFASRTQDGWLQHLRGASVPVTPLYRGAELLADPQVSARGSIRLATDAHGPVRYPAFPAVFNGVRDGEPDTGRS